MLLEKSKIWTPLQILPKNVGDLGKIIVKSCPKWTNHPICVVVVVSVTTVVNLMKHFMIVIYDSRVVWLENCHILTLGS